MRINGEKNYLNKNLNFKKYNMDQEMDRLIWNFIDGQCTTEEEELVASLLSVDSLWKNRYAELLATHEMLKKDELEMPSLRFTKSVMEGIVNFQIAPATKTYINKKIIHVIAAFFLVMIFGFFIYFIGQIHWTNQPSDSLIPTYTRDASRLNWSKLLNNSYLNIFICINIILGLIVIDKFMRKKNNFRNSEHWTEGDSA
jgi:hypothetical protein